MPPTLVADAGPQVDAAPKTADSAPAKLQDTTPKTATQQVAGNQAVQAAAKTDTTPDTPPPLDPDKDASAFPLTIFSADADLFVVPEAASRANISQRLFADANHQSAFNFVVRADVPEINNEPGRAVRVLDFAALKEDARTAMQVSLENALDHDVHTLIDILSQRFIRDRDESRLADITLRWSNRADLTDLQGTNYFDRFLNRLEGTTLIEDHILWETKKNALDWLIDEAESTQDQVLKAIALRSHRKVDYQPTEDAGKDFPNGSIIGRFYYSGGASSLAIYVIEKIVETNSLDTAMTATRNAAWTGLRAVVPGPDAGNPDKEVYCGYTLFAPTVNDPLVVRPEDDPGGRYYWYYPGTVMVGISQFEQNFAQGGEAEHLQRRAILSHALQNAAFERLDLIIGLDYDVLSTATIDERLQLIRTALTAGSKPTSASAFIARLIMSTPPGDRAQLDAELRSSELMNDIIKIPDPQITAALGPTSSEEEEDSLDRLEGSEDLFKLYRDLPKAAMAGNHFVEKQNELTVKIKQFGYGSIAEFAKAITHFEDIFQRFAVQVAFQMLDQNEALAKGEFARYAGETSTSGINDLRKELAPLAIQVNSRDAAVSARDAAVDRAATLRPAAGVSEEYSAAEEEAQRTTQQADLETKNTTDLIAGMRGRFPVLADPKIDVTALIAADDQTLQTLLLGTARGVMVNIRDARDDLSHHPSDVWTLEGVIASAREQFGVAQGSIFDLALNAKEKDEKRWELIKNIFLGALAFGLAITGNPLALAAAAGISGYTAITHILEYSTKQKMVGTAFDRAQALSADDPSFFWLALDIVGAIVDASAAAKAMSALKPLVKETLLLTDAAQQAKKLKELEAVVKSIDTSHNLEGAAQQTAKSADAIAPGAKSVHPSATPHAVPDHVPATPASKVASEAADATAKSEDLAKKIVVDVEKRIKGDAALAKLGEEGQVLLTLCKGDAAAAGGLARLEPGVRAGVVDALKDSPDAARLLGNLASESDAVAQTTEQMFKAFVANGKRADQFEAILKKYFVIRGTRIRKANMFRALGEAGLEEADFAKLAEDMKGFVATKNVQTEFSKRAIAKIADKLPPGPAGIQKITEMATWMETSAKGSVFEQWCRKHIFVGMERFSEEAANLTGKYSRTLLRSDGFLKEGEQLTIVELKNYVDTLPTFAKNTAEGKQLANYAEMINKGVKGPGGLTFGKIEYVFSTRTAAESAAENIRAVMGKNAIIHYIDPLTGSRVIL